MKAELKPAPYFVGYTGRALTYEGMLNGMWVKIWRAVGNDSGMKRDMTIELLKRHEPNVGLFPGDIIEYYDHGELIHTETP